MVSKISHCKNNNTKMGRLWMDIIVYNENKQSKDVSAAFNWDLFPIL